MNCCQDGRPTFIDRPAPANRMACRSFTASASSSGTASSIGEAPGAARLRVEARLFGPPAGRVFRLVFLLAFIARSLHEDLLFHPPLLSKHTQIAFDLAALPG